MNGAGTRSKVLNSSRTQDALSQTTVGKKKQNNDIAKRESISTSRETKTPEPFFLGI
jgi:hypothetical protein